MKNLFLKVLAVVSVLFVSQSAMAADCDPREALARAAEESGVRINHEQTVATSSSDIAFVGTSIAGFEQVPAHQLREGVDAGFVYLDAPESGIPAGFYRLHAQAPAPKLGQHEGSVSLVSQDGRVVARFPATMNTWSMEVPRPLPFERTLMEAQLHSEGGADKSLLRIRITITIRCPNGTTITIRIGW